MMASKKKNTRSPKRAKTVREQRRVSPAAAALWQACGIAISHARRSPVGTDEHGRAVALARILKAAFDCEVTGAPLVTLEQAAKRAFKATLKSHGTVAAFPDELTPPGAGRGAHVLGDPFSLANGTGVTSRSATASGIVRTLNLAIAAPTNPWAPFDANNRDHAEKFADHVMTWGGLDWVRGLTDERIFRPYTTEPNHPAELARRRLIKSFGRLYDEGKKDPETWFVAGLTGLGVERKTAWNVLAKRKP